MDVVVITQEDQFAIPRNIQRVLELDNVRIPLIVVLDCRSSLENKKSYFVKGFGLVQGMKMGLILAWYKIIRRNRQTPVWPTSPPSSPAPAAS